MPSRRILPTKTDDISVPVPHLQYTDRKDNATSHSPIDLLPHRRNSLVPPKEEHHIAYQPWLKNPEIFSHCQLAYDSDRLAALAGLITTKQMDEYKGVRNLFGLWERDLHVELCWVANIFAGTGVFKGLTFLQHLALPSWT
ncbi:uncharacterized protein PV06_01000 [Exophiala oligosperma]|uniref:Uncharacterized protein n=1 Tax=Exophiala oligosperma TaxID=215243 RepID=A0A0D2DZ81_9EURO|nr:uncharacterized protein PV06_01000 [Exophiala oligosperma]KIW48413.1 hypothetical protein PV06_01000 [Exophiala oligosperma]